MGCSKCGRPGVIFQGYSGLHLCMQHFKEDFLHKAKKTVRQHHWLVPEAQIAVALSGGPASCALLDFMRTIVGERKDIRLVAVTIKNNRPYALENAKKIVEASGIPLYIFPKNSESIPQGERRGPTHRSPFPAHASIESQLILMTGALKIDTLALGYTLETHAEWVIRNAILGDSVRKSGCTPNVRPPVRVIRPFMHIPVKETDLYTQLFLNGQDEKAETEGKDHPGDPVSSLLAQLYSRHPAIPYALVNIGEQKKKFRGRGLS